jgi:hypothetical protein
MQRVPPAAARNTGWWSDIVGTTLFVDGGMTLYPGFKKNG